MWGNQRSTGCTQDSTSRSDYSTTKPLAIPGKKNESEPNFKSRNLYSNSNFTSNSTPNAMMPSPPSSPMSPNSLLSSASLSPISPVSPSASSPTARQTNRYGQAFAEQQMKRYANMRHASTSTMPSSMVPRVPAASSFGSHSGNDYNQYSHRRRYSETIHDREPCLRHHQRRSSVAIKFKPTYLQEDYELRDPKDLDPEDPSFASLESSRASSVNVKRPPTPIAERILKGDFSF